ncbi:hypothetical protein INT47_003344 [Mucor saturninus]|uniref:Uncharacterized protein n=1 Tax=Mucor saturninus TaxID=64648 RepID=A0A8H7RF97_9FUNG|nr:hypothetical protein INT47_003344 [Mucor saturninus]
MLGHLEYAPYGKNEVESTFSNSLSIPQTVSHVYRVGRCTLPRTNCQRPSIPAKDTRPDIFGNHPIEDFWNEEEQKK